MSLFPFVIFFYCLFIKGAILDGWAGIHYAFQRMLAETLLALYLIEDDLRGQASSMEQGARSRGPAKDRRQRSEARGQAKEQSAKS